MASLCTRFGAFIVIGFQSHLAKAFGRITLRWGVHRGLCSPNRWSLCLRRRANGPRFSHANGCSTGRFRQLQRCFPAASRHFDRTGGFTAHWWLVASVSGQKSTLEIVKPGNEFLPGSGDVVEQARFFGVNGDAAGHTDAQLHGTLVARKRQAHLEALRGRDPIRLALHIGKHSGRYPLPLPDPAADRKNGRRKQVSRHGTKGYQRRLSRAQAALHWRDRVPYSGLSA